MPTVAIRPGEPADIDEIVDLWLELVREQRPFGTALRADDNRRVARRWTVELVARDCVTVAVRDDEVIGFASYEREYDRFERDVTSGVVHNLMVAPPDRGTGIGTDLLSAVERRLADRGVDRVRLDAMAGNDDAARFYRDRGYGLHRQTFAKRLPETDTHNTDPVEE